VKIAVLKDAGGDEARVAATPETVAGYIKAGHDVTVVKSAGKAAHFYDDDYKNAGASMAASNTAAVKSADLVMSISGADKKLLSSMKKGAGITGLLNPTDNPDYAAAAAKAGVTAYAL